MADATVLRQRTIRYGAELMREAEAMMVAELREAAPLGETGDTRRGIDSAPGGTDTVPAFTVVSRSPHGDFVEEGTQAHEIPRGGSSAGITLRWVGGGARISQPSPNQRIATRQGGVRFARRVWHPGTPARPWFHPVADRFAEFLERAAARVQA